MADEERQQGGHSGQARVGPLPVFQERPSEPPDTHQPDLSLTGFGEEPLEAFRMLLLDTLVSLPAENFLLFRAGKWEEKSVANNLLSGKSSRRPLNCPGPI